MNPIASEYIVRQHTKEIREYASAINRAQKQRKHRNNTSQIWEQIAHSISAILAKLNRVDSIRRA